MSAPYIFDVSTEAFADQVVRRSHKQPVLVLDWSPRVNPSLLLVPRLLRLATQCNGRFQLALHKVEHEGAGADPGALPRIRLYLDGCLAGTLDGERSETELRAFLAGRIRLRGAARLYADAVKAYGADDAERGLQLASEAALMEPDNVQTPIDVVKLLVLAGRFDQAEALLRALPQKVRDDAEIRNLMAHLSFIRVSADAPPIPLLETTVTTDPWNLDARYQLAARKVVHNDIEGAMQQLLEISRRNPSFRDNAGRNGLLALFHMLGEDDDRVRRFRPLLQEALN
jgi:putative thioredoxin